MALSRPTYDTTLTPGAATPLQIAIQGHIAIFLRRYLNETGMSPPDFHQYVMGVSRKATMIYPWLNATNRPSAQRIHQLARVLGVPRAFFKPHDPDRGDPPVQPETFQVPAEWTRARNGAGKALVARKGDGPRPATSVLLTPRKPAQAPAFGSPKPVLAFHLFEDDTATVEVRARLPGEQGKSLLRVLLEAGLTNTVREPVPPEEDPDG